jgi:hypothetical protein
VKTAMAAPAPPTVRLVMFMDPPDHESCAPHDRASP